MQVTALIALSAVLLSSSDCLAQQPVSPKRVLMLYWDEKDYPANVEFESQFQAALRSAASRPIELYSEFLESNRFPGENQSELLRDYIKQKYAGRTVDVVVPTAAAPLDFLFKYHSDLFPQVPVVFSSAGYPSAEQLRSGAGATGIVIANTYRKTLDLALRLHPDTQQVFVVSGTMAGDRFYEKAARSQLDGYENRAAITYLTDLPLEELKVRLSNLPERSIVLYVWDWARNTGGKFLESREVLDLIAPSARVPMYGMSFANVGHGIVGGDVWTMETATARLAQMTLKLAYGARTSDIPVENAPDTPMFDWRQLRRWNISEDRLPGNSVIRFRELTLWQRYKWYVVGAIGVIVLETLLIGMLLILRRRERQGAAALDKTRQVLRESEERFRNMADTAPVMIVVSDANRKVSFCNKTWLEFTGRTMEQELGQGGTGGMHPADWEDCTAKLRNAYEAGSEYELEYRLLRSDGEYRSVICRGLPRLEPDGTLAGYIESVIDITERKQAEDVHSHLAALVESSNDAIIGTTVHGEITSWNPSAERIYGYKAEEMVGRPLSLLVPPDSPDQIPQIMEHLRHGGRFEQYETTHIRKGGGRIEISANVSPIRDSTGAPVGASVIARDITEQKRAEAVLRESEERFRRVFEEGPLGLALVGRDYHFVKVNSALCRMVGYSETELLQKSFVDITHRDDVGADVELAEHLFKGEKPFYKLRKRYVKKDGEIVWINLTGSLIRDEQGEPIHGLAMIEDITEVKRAQEEALARQKLESLGVLAGGIAHDFNNLLGGILASTELALAECNDGSAVGEELQRIKITSIRVAEIVRELMIYGGEESPTLELVDISDLVNEMLQLLKVSISKHTILKIELGQDLPPIQGNPAQIRQVVMNLVTNASEAIGERSGEIRVTSGKVKVGPGSPVPGGKDLAEGDYLRLEVFDTGRGMPPEVQTRIFDPFFSTKHAGRGLGLAAVQGIIRSHGGMINVESSIDQGSRFEILLPCFDQATQNTNDTTVTPSATEPGTIAGTVLVVEDEETLRLAVSKKLRNSGFSVIEAGDGTTGANLFRANERKIDVVLLDMTLPEMSGRDVLEELRRIRPGVKVILTTAFSQASALSSIAEKHLWGFVRKPYKLSELTSLLRKACLDKPKMSGNVAG